MTIAWSNTRGQYPEQLGEGESVITRAGERMGAGWVRVLRSGAAKQGALLREREIQSLRGEIKALQQREGAQPLVGRDLPRTDRTHDQAGAHAGAAHARGLRRPDSESPYRIRRGAPGIPP